MKSSIEKKHEIIGVESQKAPRFEVPTNNEARERLMNFRKNVKELCKTEQGFLGATIYGSMIKGEKAHEGSDIDAFIYIDAQEQITNEGLSLNPGKDEVDIIKRKSLENLYSKMGLNENEILQYYRDVRPVILSEEILDDEIGKFLEKSNAYKDYQEYESSISWDERKEMTDEERAELDDRAADLATLDFGIKGMFHARVGDGIQKYREMFLEKVYELSDEDSTEIWGDVLMNLQTFEQRHGEGKEIKLPETLEDAINLYHPKLRSKIEAKRIQALQQEISNSYHSKG